MELPYYDTVKYDHRHPYRHPVEPYHEITEIKTGDHFDDGPHEWDAEKERAHHRRARKGYTEEEQLWHEDHHLAHALHSHHKFRRAHAYDYHDSDEDSDDYIENPYEFEVEWKEHYHPKDEDSDDFDHHWIEHEDHWKE